DRRRARDLCRARGRLRHGGLARRRQRRAGGLCRGAMGVRAGPFQQRPNPDRVLHLPRRRPLHVGRPNRVSSRGRGAAMAARRSDRAPPPAPGRTRRVGRRPPRRPRQGSRRGGPRRAEGGGEARHPVRTGPDQHRKHVRRRLRRAPLAPGRAARRGAGGAAL
ncbi:MAG: Branched-chain alpha-keto acid dehydrogenase, E1 component, alpha subunit, partial [uncultured Sphingomonas sp.]